MVKVSFKPIGRRVVLQPIETQVLLYQCPCDAHVMPKSCHPYFLSKTYWEVVDILQDKELFFQYFDGFGVLRTVEKVRNLCLLKFCVFRQEVSTNRFEGPESSVRFTVFYCLFNAKFPLHV